MTNITELGIKAALLSAALLINVFTPVTAQAETTVGDALPGQIVVHPANPRWFFYNRDANGDGKLDPFFWTGPGGPEDFFYRGARNADGTRSGDQMNIINSFGATGANGLYVMAVRSHGGDGDATHNPFINNDPNQGLNQAVLNQWDTWLAALESKGIVVSFILYDDSADPFKTSNLGVAEKRFIDDLVNRFERHNNIIWNIAEEYNEVFANYPSRVSQIAAEIRAADDHDHPIAVAHPNGDLTMDFPSDANIDQFALQSNATTPRELYDDVLVAFREAAGRWNVAMVENWNYGQNDHAWDLKNNNRVDARKRNWAAAMAGGYVLVLGTWESVGAAPPSAWLADWGNQARFFESTNFHEMQPDTSNRRGGTEYLLSKPGDSYIAYASALAGNLGIGGFTAGNYDLIWLDIATNQKVTQKLTLGNGDVTFTRPAGIGTELALHVKRLAADDLPKPQKRTYLPQVLFRN